MSIDTQAIKQNTDLLSLVGTGLRKVAATRGGEWAGPCPRCGGSDRFRVQPEAGVFMCRKCHDSWGDAIELVTWRDGLGFREACERLGGVVRDVSPGSGTRRYKRDSDTPSDAPSDVWRSRAADFVAWSQAELWKHPDALAHLYSRGLRADTVLSAGLGFNPETLHDKGDRWGYTSGRQWLPSGYVIPCEMGGELWYVKIRRPGADSGDKYICIRGSHKRGVVYGLDALGDVWDVVICEGELNALSLRQELAGVCGVVSVGDAGNVPGPEALAHLMRVPRWWSLYDPDEAGAVGSDKLGDLSQRVHRLDWPWGDLDANDALQAGHDLATWAIPQIGPSDPDKRAAWLTHWLNILEDDAREENDNTPEQRAWQALWEGFILTTAGDG